MGNDQLHRDVLRFDRMLVIWLLLVLVGFPGHGLAREKREEIDVRELESEVAIRINEYRVSAGKRLFESNETVAEVARGHSRDMARGRVRFGHEGLKKRAARIGASIEIVGVAENVSKHDRSSGFVEAALKQWLASPPHKKNIEGDYDLAGVGAARSANGVVYFTQIFVKKR